MPAFGNEERSTSARGLAELKGRFDDVSCLIIGVSPLI